MNCPVCEAEMQPLFIGHYCPSCETRGKKPVALEDTYGFIVWRSRPEGSGEYVFMTETGALKWRAAAGLDTFPVRLVTARVPFVWKDSTGSVRDIKIAEGLFLVYRERDELGLREVRLIPEDDGA